MVSQLVPQQKNVIQGLEQKTADKAPRAMMPDHLAAADDEVAAGLEQHGWAVQEALTVYANEGDGQRE